MKTTLPLTGAQKTQARSERPRRSMQPRNAPGADNKGVQFITAELASTDDRPVNRTPEAHYAELRSSERETAQRVLPVDRAQLPGCLPAGYDLDSMLTPEQFCVWQQVGRDWFKARRASLPGVSARSRKMVRIHPRTYIDKTVKGAKS